MRFSSSKKLINNVSSFITIQLYRPIYFNKKIFYGWGRKKSGLHAINLANKHHTSFVLLEDGFIRSLDLGVNDSPSFSIVKDNIGIYYDATTPSKLENIFNNYAFSSDKQLMVKAQQAIEMIKTYHISKYNSAPDIQEDFFNFDKKRDKVLIILQTKGDSSLKYGLGNKFRTKQIIDDAIDENPQASIYIKIHPDVLAGKKNSDIAIDEIPKECVVIAQDVNPISLLKHFTKVYTKTSGMGMEALILGLEVVCYGMPYYAGWGLTIDKQKCARRKRTLLLEELFAGAYILYTHYYNPFSKKKTDIIDTIISIAKYRKIYQENSGNLYFFGFSHWKRKNTQLFFPTFQQNTLFFCSSLTEAFKKGLSSNDKIYIWGKKPFDDVENYANEKKIPLLRVEDGFIRSVSLGSDLTKAYSLVVDNRGIYFDASCSSDLEYLLENTLVDSTLLKRSHNIQHYLIENKISKYNIYKDKKISFKNVHKNQSIALVIGQVEDDASIQYSANGMTNLSLLQEVKKNYSNAYIVYKPHPDVLAGNRVGNIEDKIALKYCDSVIKKSSLDSVLEKVDEIHTMTSLVGFEALIRGKKVYTYGLPFYAGWGLTIDTKKTKRRTKKLSLNELVAISLICYPRYLHPKTNQLCEIEVLLEAIDKEKKRYNNTLLYKIYIHTRNFISRKIQLLIKVFIRE